MSTDRDGFLDIVDIAEPGVEQRLGRRRLPLASRMGGSRQSQNIEVRCERRIDLAISLKSAERLAKWFAMEERGRAVG